MGCWVPAECSLSRRLSPSPSTVGGWSPIKNLGDPHVREIANFAVEEHDKQAGENQILIKVLRGETQIVSGVNYRLVIKVADGDALEDFEVIVWDKPWAKFRKLTSFRPIKHQRKP
ncbi:Cysteine proteinase inhibitor 5 [Platanthera guangdongensis]|uniref:Cysteine proteinase inhibitor 5 n=1 Tax=Platanthera guangdongensis TaxID=2320717 RepID=A0ABR2LEH2_9ASPA